jgi:hypothetical protein
MPGVWCYPNHPIIAAGDPYAVTYGNHIFCKQDCTEILLHEGVHTVQYGKEPGFAIRYLFESLFNGTCLNHKFEAPAYAAGGSCKG